MSTDYQNQLGLNGFLTASGRVRRKIILEELYELSEGLFISPTHLSVRSRLDFSFVSTFLSGQYPQHPFKHLLFEFFLSRCRPFTGVKDERTPPKKGLFGVNMCSLLKSVEISQTRLSRRRSVVSVGCIVIQSYSVLHHCCRRTPKSDLFRVISGQERRIS